MYKLITVEISNIHCYRFRLQKTETDGSGRMRILFAPRRGLAEQNEQLMEKMNDALGRKN